MSSFQKTDTIPIILYSLQSCGHCKDVKKMLQHRQVPFKTVYVDMLVGNERSDVLRDVKKVNPSVSFPTLVIGEKVIVGFKLEAIEEALETLL
jgi:glutaredoxin